MHTSRDLDGSGANDLRGHLVERQDLVGESGRGYETRHTPYDASSLGRTALAQHECFIGHQNETTQVVCGRKKRNRNKRNEWPTARLALEACLKR